MKTIHGSNCERCTRKLIKTFEKLEIIKEEHAEMIKRIKEISWQEVTDQDRKNAAALSAMFLNWLVKEN